MKLFSISVSACSITRVTILPFRSTAPTTFPCLQRQSPACAYPSAGFCSCPRYGADGLGDGAGGIAPLSKACSCSPVESRKSKSENRDEPKGPGADGPLGGADGFTGPGPTCGSKGPKARRCPIAGAMGCFGPDTVSGIFGIDGGLGIDGGAAGFAVSLE
jgi:hypothetical protein